VSGRPLPFAHPASLIATWFGSGYLPKVPGTWGSLASLPFAAVIVLAGGPWALLAAAVAVFLAGLWASGVYAARSGAEDPQAVVVDEVAGQWLAIVPVALDPPFYAVAFLLFRVFDIVKVWPAGLVDRRLKGAPGIMLDDVVAGLYAGAGSYALLLLIQEP
jgi:phosphatidylglycerophosphatase A